LEKRERMLNHFLIIDCDDIDSASVGIEAKAYRFSMFEPTVANEFTCNELFNMSYYV